MPIVATTLPFLLLLALTVMLRRPLWQSGLVAFFVAVLLWTLVPGVTLAELVAPATGGLIVSTEVGLILIGAISFLELMNRRGTTGRIKAALSGVSSGNPALEALLLAWLFCGFLEGAAGFGAPAALVAPLLNALGFSPIVAAILPLIGDSAAVPFGAVGTPVRVGFAGLPSEGAATVGAGVNLVAGFVPPVMIYLIAFRQRMADRENRLPLRGILTAFWAGVCFTVPSFLLVFVGPEFPSLGGALAGMVIFSVTLLKMSGAAIFSSETGKRLRDLVSAFSPYLLLCLLLLLGKYLLGPHRIALRIGEQTVGFSVFQPGLLFIVTILLVWFGDGRRPPRLLKALFLPAGKKLPSVWLAIFCMAGLAQFVVQLGDLNTAFESVFGDANGKLLLVMLAPFAGAAGSFIAGSATVSNLLMAPLLYQVCLITGADPGLILGLQLAGAGAGNMISLQNLAAVQATVGLANREGEMLKQLWLPCGAYLGVAMLAGLIFTWVSG